MQLPHIILAEVNFMFVISIGNTKKKLRLTAKILLVLVLLLLLSYLFNHTLLTSSDQTAMVPDTVSTDGTQETNYPGEPIRVYNSFENYWLDMLESVANE
jgi:hypothetical protein